MTLKELTKAELIVMKCAWDAGEDMVLSEFVTRTHQKFSKTWKPQTVSTYLAHLVKKGFLRMDKLGKIYTYHPLISEDTYRQKIFDEFKDFWDINSLSDFIEIFFDTNSMNETEYVRIKELFKNRC